MQVFDLHFGCAKIGKNSTLAKGMVINMTVQKVFARYEIKYLVTKEQRALIEEAMDPYMQADKFGRSDICSVYYDTPDYLLIRRSIESPVYKEKLRLRSYGIADSESIVYAEIKKKYKSVVYKRRVGMELEKAEAYLSGNLSGDEMADGQISRELDFMLKRYDTLRPAALVSGEREAYYASDDREFRVTFDENIFGRDWDLTLGAGIYGIPLLGGNQVLMEIKTGGAIPLWMCSILSSERIYKTSFSKYGTVYKDLIKPKKEPYHLYVDNKNVTKPIQWIV